LGGYTNALPWWLGRADAFISASFVEGHPNVVIEAAAAGCPLILSDIPAHREFAVGDSALFAPTRDASALAGALVDTVLDCETSKLRAQRARSLVAELTVESAARQYIDLYRTLIKTSRRP
jgi:glycosyltransferase involved in cell wall biosynthesis